MAINWVLVIALVCSTIAVIFLIWIDYKRDKDIPKNQQDPMMSALFMALIFFVVSLLITFGLEAMNKFEDGWTQDHIIWHIGLMIAVFGLSIWAKRKIHPKSIEKLQLIADEYIEEFFPNQEFTDPGIFPSPKMIKVHEDTFYQLIYRKSIVSDLIDGLLISLDIYSGYLKNYVYSPEQSEVSKVFEIIPKVPRSTVHEELEQDDKEERV